MTEGWFPNWKWFHRKFHVAATTSIEGEPYLLCQTCDRYVPPMPVGSCCECGCAITPSIKQFCKKCSIPKFLKVKGAGQDYKSKKEKPNKAINPRRRNSTQSEKEKS